VWKAGMANTDQKPDHSYNNILQALRESQMSCAITNLLLKLIEKTLICSSGSIFDNHPIQNDIYTHYFQ
jgi:hypothetical protein